MTKRQDRYREAGVDIDLAHDLLGRVKDRITATKRPEVLAPIGGFGGLFQLDLARYPQPVLVSSIDSVGTKVMVALRAGSCAGLGHDIVNHCINDIAVQGAEPLYFLDYLGIGRLRSPLYEDLLTGLAEACAAQGITLLGGETAELPGMYGEEFDLVGCVTGVVNRGELLTGEAVRPGHTIIGLASTGLHTNGYSLARRVLFEEAGLTVNDQPADLGESLGRALLRPHRCYWPAIRRAREVGVALDGIAHITGGGWYDNVPRIMSDDVAAVFEDNDLPVPPIFHLIQDRGGVEPTEMYRVFNMGMGMAWFVPPEHETSALACCREVGIPAAVVGRATARSAGLPAVTIAWVE